SNYLPTRSRVGQPSCGKGRNGTDDRKKEANCADGTPRVTAMMEGVDEAGDPHHHEKGEVCHGPPAISGPAAPEEGHNRPDQSDAAEHHPKRDEPGGEVAPLHHG